MYTQEKGPGVLTEVINVTSMSCVCLNILKEFRNWKDTAPIFTVTFPSTRRVFFPTLFMLHSSTFHPSFSPFRFSWLQSLYFVFMAPLYCLFLLQFDEHNYLHIHFPEMTRFFSSIPLKTTPPCLCITWSSCVYLWWALRWGVYWKTCRNNVSLHIQILNIPWRISPHMEMSDMFSSNWIWLEFGLIGYGHSCPILLWIPLFICHPFTFCHCTSQTCLLRWISCG